MAAMAIMRLVPGSPWKSATRHCTDLSANPPKYPDTMPKDNPSAMVQNAEQNAKATEDRAP